jgi:hypothetical protein
MSNEITIEKMELFSSYNDEGQRETRFGVQWSDGSYSDYAEAIEIIAVVVADIMDDMEADKRRALH